MASSSSSSIRKWEYDVFLSFRGEDTRKSFTDHLYKSLRWEGITIFRDDDEIQQGVTISSKLLRAIESSRVSIIVLSKNYASSTWCLEELVKIIQCKEELGMDVLPVFYQVDPSDVRKQKGSFAEAFVKHESNTVGSEKLQKWRDALAQVAGFKGWNSNDWPYETKLIEDISQVIWTKIRPTMTVTRNDLVGIDSKYNEMLSLMDLKSDGIVLVGIWGMGGIGKTTLARFVYDKILHEFEVCCFLSEMKELFQGQRGLAFLQSQLLSSIFTHKVDIWDAHQGFSMIEKAFRYKKVLLVLDDVDRSDQINGLIPNPTSLRSGSRIIITTRNVDFLESFGVERRYEVGELDKEKALQLLHLAAFPKAHPKEGYLDLSKSIIKLVGGVPLALQVLGSSLCNKDVATWKFILEELKDCVVDDDKIFKVLKISYDGLDEKEKKIFLDIACFFKGKKRDRVVEILDGCGFGATRRVELLIRKSLITVSYENRLGMHCLLQDMGRRIVRQQEVQNRLWCYNDANKMLKKEVVIEAIESVFLKPRKKIEITNFLSKMYNLRMLNVNCHVQVGNHLDCIPTELRYLKWNGCPLEFLPLNSEENELIELHMCHSNLKQFWRQKKCLEKLKYIKFSHCQKLFKTPDFCHVPNLERLDLLGCTSLRKIHPSIFMARRLVFLNLKDCINLSVLPSCIKIEALEVLILSGCSKIKKISEFSGNTERLLELHLDGTSIKELPPSVASLNGLTLLHMKNCKKLVSFSSTVLPMLKSLQSQDLSGCSGHDNQQKSSKEIEYLEELDVRGTATKQVQTVSVQKSVRRGLLVRGLMRRIMQLFFKGRQSGIGMTLSFSSLYSLIELDLSDCNLQALPDGVGSLSSLKQLTLCGNHFSYLPLTISQLAKLEIIHVSGCKKLQSLPDLPSNVHDLSTHNCISLKKFPCFPVIYINNKHHGFELVLSNCSELLHTEEMHRLLMSYIQIVARQLRFVNIKIPGSEVPKWFTKTKTGSSISIELGDFMSTSLIVCGVCSYTDQKFITYSTCMVRGTLKTDESKSISSNLPYFILYDRVYEMDHIWIVSWYPNVLLRLLQSSKSENISLDNIKEIELQFYCGPSAAGIKVKQCGYYNWMRKD